MMTLPTIRRTFQYPTEWIEGFPNEAALRDHICEATSNWFDWEIEKTSPKTNSRVRIDAIGRPRPGTGLGSDALDKFGIEVKQNGNQQVGYWTEWAVQAIEYTRAFDMPVFAAPNFIQALGGLNYRSNDYGLTLRLLGRLNVGELTNVSDEGYITPYWRIRRTGHVLWHSTRGYSNNLTYPFRLRGRYNEI